MQFNSYEFLIFFPIVVLVYLVVPKRIRSIWLLISSYYFYMSWNPKYAILIVLSTVITFLCGILIEKYDDIRQKKIVIFFSVFINLLILAVFKYSNFVVNILIKDICSFVGINFSYQKIDLLLPVGISFYTFQALGYTIDVYRQNIKAEKNIVNYALFVSFFPQLVAGPIERSGNLLKQIRNVKNLKLYNYDRIRDGLMLMFWGLFQKIVIADRASIVVNEVFSNYENCGFVELSIASVLFAIQIYCDFGGYTNIARGASKVMGFELMNNFRQPYLASNIKDFWDRWHISLTKWFTDYLYIPLGGGRRGLSKKCINIFIVFALSGLWHGSNWNFIVWGVIHGILRIANELRTQIEKKIGILKEKEHNLSERIRNVIVTFIMVDFAWIFFAAGNIKKSLGIIRCMVSRFQGEFQITMDINNIKILIISIIILFIVDLIHEANISLFKFINKQEIWFRWILYMGLIWSIILFGIYGKGYDTSQFIYFQF